MDSYRDAMQTLWAVMMSVRDSYGVKFAFVDAPADAAATNDLDRKIDEILAEADDLDDEEVPE